MFGVFMEIGGRIIYAAAFLFVLNIMEVSKIAKDQTIINDRIRAKEVRLIAQDGEQVGVKPTKEAMEMAERVELEIGRASCRERVKRTVQDVASKNKKEERRDRYNE